MMRGGRAPAKPILVPPGRVIARQSTDTIAIDDPDIAAAVRYIREHVHEPTSVKDLLGAVPISRKKMERRFEKILGRTPGEEIARVHIESAISLLEQTDLPIPVVAKRAGFTGRIVFSAFFHRHKGLSPTQYRRKHRAGGMG
jgi:LacI family transcriptional regulator